MLSTHIVNVFNASDRWNTEGKQLLCPRASFCSVPPLPSRSLAACITDQHHYHRNGYEAFQLFWDIIVVFSCCGQHKKKTHTHQTVTNSVFIGEVSCVPTSGKKTCPTRNEPRDDCLAATWTGNKSCPCRRTNSPI